MAPEIKFCGLTREVDAGAAALLGARYVGVVFAPSPRRLDPPRAARVLDAASSWSKRVGVFDARSAAEIARIAREVGLQIVQLHGDPTESLVAELRAHYDGAIWAVVRVAGTSLPAATAALFVGADAVVLDARVEDTLGGTGVSLDWHGLSSQIARARQGGPAAFVLAGGLRPENVARAVQALHPDVVDVSSGVESAPGVKDHARMRAFADAVARGHAA